MSGLFSVENRFVSGKLSVVRPRQGGKHSVDECRPPRLGGSFSVNNRQSGKLSVENLMPDKWRRHPHCLYPSDTTCEVGTSAQTQRDGWELQRDANDGQAYVSHMEENHLSQIGSQLDLLGLEETRRMAVAGVSKPRERRRKLDQVEATHELLSALPAAEDLSFLHSGLCQTCLPHSRPAKNTAIWRRHSGRFTLIVTPGLIDSSALDTRNRQPTEAETDAMYVGVPYGTNRMRKFGFPARS